MEQKKTVEKNIIKCNLCGNMLCSNCNSTYHYTKWQLCSTCYKNFKDKQTKRIDKIKEKRKIRKNNEKFKGEFTVGIFGPLFENLLKGLSDSGVEDIILRINPATLDITSMDLSRISVTIISFNAKNLLEYNYNHQRTVNLKVEDILNVIPSFTERKVLLIQRKKGSLDLKIKSGKHCFTIKDSETIAEELPTQNLLKIEYKNIFSISAVELCDILENATKTSVVIGLKISSNIITFYTETTEKGSYEYSYKTPSELEIPESFRATGYYIIFFSSIYLYSLIKKLLPWIKKDVEMHVKYDNPLKIGFELDGDHSIVSFVAPIVEDDPDDFIDEEEDDDDND